MHKIHKHAISDFCLRAEKGSVFCQFTAHFWSYSPSTSHLWSTWSYSSNYAAVLSESVPSMKSILMQQ